MTAPTLTARDPLVAIDRDLTARELGALAAFAGIVLVPVSLVGAAVAAGALPVQALDAATPIAMLLPTVAALVALAIWRPTAPATRLGLRPSGGWPRALAWTIGAFAIVTAIGLGTVLGAAALDIAPFALPDLGALALAALPLIGMALVLALGEELGWRGALQSMLAPHGFWRASITISVLWTLWHLPLLAASVAVGGMPLWAAATTVVNLLLAGVALSLLRDLGGSALPAATGHAALNTTLLLATNQLLGGGPSLGIHVVGWGVWLVAIAVLAVLRLRARGRMGA